MNAPPVDSDTVRSFHRISVPMAVGRASQAIGSTATTSIPWRSALAAIRRPASSPTATTVREANVPSKSRALAAS